MTSMIDTEATRLRTLEERIVIDVISFDSEKYIGGVSMRVLYADSENLQPAHSVRVEIRTPCQGGNEPNKPNKSSLTGGLVLMRLACAAAIAVGEGLLNEKGAI